MITRAMKDELRALGYTDEEIVHLTPQQAKDTVKDRRRSAGGGEPSDAGAAQRAP